MNTEEIEMERGVAFVRTFNFVRAGGGVRRFHTRYVSKEETVAAHSWGVACMADALCGGAPSAALLRAALYHDVPEAVVGDVPSPTKRALSSAQLNNLEEGLLRTHGLEVKLSAQESVVLKLADLLDGAMFCVEEAERGNRTLSDILVNYVSYVNDEISRVAAIGAADVELLGRAGALLGCISGRLEALYERK